MIMRCGGNGLKYLIAFGLGVWFAKNKMHRERRCEVHREWHHGPPPGSHHGPWCHGPWCQERHGSPSGNTPQNP
jgi:hypothetical protein